MRIKIKFVQCLTVKKNNGEINTSKLTDVSKFLKFLNFIK